MRKEAKYLSKCWKVDSVKVFIACSRVDR